MEEGRNGYRILLGKPEGTRPQKDEGVDGRIGSKCTLGRLVGGGGGGGLTWLRIGIVGRLL
jgi:hypothetical protein